MKRFLNYLMVLMLVAGVVWAGEKKNDEKGKEGTKPTLDSTAIVWYPYDQGLKLAKESGKHILVDFTAKWCGYCKKMDKEVFTDSEVIKFLNTHFVCVKVDGDSPNELNIEGYKITEQNLARAEYRVSGYPTFWFLKATSERIGPAAGYRPKDQFLDLAYFVKDDLYDKMSFNDYMTKGGRKSAQQN